MWGTGVVKLCQFWLQELGLAHITVEVLAQAGIHTPKTRTAAHHGLGHRLRTTNFRLQPPARRGKPYFVTIVLVPIISTPLALVGRQAARHPRAANWNARMAGLCRGNSNDA